MSIISLTHMTFVYIQTPTASWKSVHHYVLVHTIHIPVLEMHNIKYIVVFNLKQMNIRATEGFIKMYRSKQAYQM